MAQRHGNLFSSIVDSGNLSEAHARARKGKSAMSNVIDFDRDIEGNLKRVRQSLMDKTFTTSKYQEKLIHVPKTRTIYVLPFKPDRIVQHALMRVVEPIWDRLMISDSYACRTGKGQHTASRRTMEFVRQYKYCLQADISKFYPSIDQAILADIVRQKIKCKDTLWLIDDIIYSFPGEKNVPIGNYTSQWFGNLYLHELDRTVKHVYKIPAYLRYCDDFCLFSNDKRQLQELKETIREFLAERLKLTYSFAEVFPTKHGVDFLGYRHFPKGYILLRKSTAQRVKRRLKLLPKLLALGKVTPEQYRSSLASTRGWLKWANTHNLQVATCLDRLEGKLK
jgi:retron-type reverse transcriptase